MIALLQHSPHGQNRACRVGSLRPTRCVDRLALASPSVQHSFADFLAILDGFCSLFLAAQTQFELEHCKIASSFNRSETAQAARINVCRESSMTYWPDHSPSGNQKRF